MTLTSPNYRTNTSAYYSKPSYPTTSSKLHHGYLMLSPPDLVHDDDEEEEEDPTPTPASPPSTPPSCLAIKQRQQRQPDNCQQQQKQKLPSASIAAMLPSKRRKCTPRRSPSACPNDFVFKWASSTSSSLFRSISFIQQQTEVLDKKDPWIVYLPHRPNTSNHITEALPLPPPSSRPPSPVTPTVTALSPSSTTVTMSSPSKRTMMKGSSSEDYLSKDTSAFFGSFSPCSTPSSPPSSVMSFDRQHDDQHQHQHRYQHKHQHVPSPPTSLPPFHTKDLSTTNSASANANSFPAGSSFSSGRPVRMKGPCQACHESSEACMRKAFDWPFPSDDVYFDKGRSFVYLCNKCGLRYNKSGGSVCRKCRWVLCKEEKRKVIQMIDSMRTSRPDGKISLDDDITSFVCTPKYWHCGQPWKVSWVLNNADSNDSSQRQV